MAIKECGDMQGHLFQARYEDIEIIDKEALDKGIIDKEALDKGIKFCDSPKIDVENYKIKSHVYLFDICTKCGKKIVKGE
jgi:hypothetical protein